MDEFELADSLLSMSATKMTSYQCLLPFASYKVQV